MFCSDPFDPAVTVIESVKRQKKGIATKNFKVILDRTVTIIFAHII